MTEHNQIISILNTVHILSKPFANLEKGEKIYCFAETETHYWVALPRPWHAGIVQVKVDKKLLLTLI